MSGPTERWRELEEHLRSLQARRLRLTLDFEPGAHGAGRILVEDDAGRTVLAVTAESPEELTSLLAHLVVLGFRSASAPLPKPATPRSQADVLVAGVDGYRRGWVAVSLDPSGDVQVSTHASFEEVLKLSAQVIAVDIPIDPPGLGARATDAAARAFVGTRASSVFPTPPRAALERRTFAEANEVARSITGKGLSQQAYALGRKILEVHELAAGDHRVIEMHPEVSFCALAGVPLAESKHTAEGLARRRQLLLDAGIDLPAAFAGVPEADLLDAAAGAWSAARYARGTARAFPAEHGDRLGAIWA